MVERTQRAPLEIQHRCKHASGELAEVAYARGLARGAATAPLPPSTQTRAAPKPAGERTSATPHRPWGWKKVGRERSEARPFNVKRSSF